MMEIWRAIPRLPGYEASSKGKIRRTVKGANGWNPHELRGSVSKKGYRNIGVILEGRKRNFPVHILVCEAFHGLRPSRRHEAAHWDGDSLHNDESNLRWTTPEGNAADRLRHGRYAVGSEHTSARLHERDIPEIFAMAKAKTYQRAIAAFFGVNQATVLRVLQRKTWKHVSIAEDLVREARSA